MKEATRQSASDPRPGRGFGAMSPQRQRQVASAGGKAAHAGGNAHEFTPEEARAGGVKGGHATVAKYGRQHMVTLGRRGGIQRAENRLRAKLATAQALAQAST